ALRRTQSSPSTFILPTAPSSHASLLVSIYHDLGRWACLFLFSTFALSHRKTGFFLLLLPLFFREDGIIL
ncbi:hypothetical protein, partial [uncultured Bilophila sp.]